MSDDMIELLLRSTDSIERVVISLGAHFESPAVVGTGERTVFRHQAQHDLLMSYLKCVRCVSLLRAGALLLNAGHWQEIGILCRCLSESTNDVLFLATALGENGQPSNDQKRLVAEFFQEEFEDPNRPLSTQASRDRVAREKVVAGIARIDGFPINPSDGKVILRQLDAAFSGYVHGAYPHIMELFHMHPSSGGAFAMGGVPASRIRQMGDALLSRCHLVACSTGIVARRLGVQEQCDRLLPIIAALAEATGSDEVLDPDSAVRNMKAKEAQ